MRLSLSPHLTESRFSEILSAKICSLLWLSLKMARTGMRIVWWAYNERETLCSWTRGFYFTQAFIIQWSGFYFFLSCRNVDLLPKVISNCVTERLVFELKSTSVGTWLCCEMWHTHTQCAYTNTYITVLSDFESPPVDSISRRTANVQKWSVLRKPEWRFHQLIRV